jgi:MobA/MobL family
MATFYLRTRTGLACRKAGRRHAAYIAGKQQYCDKTEVKFVIDKNLPAWAKNADEFFAAADDNERANGRSYRSIVFAIPHEATDKNQWAQQLVQQLVGERHAYRLAVHIPANGHNPHAHLMFSERGLKDLEAEKFFGRSNAKDPTYSGRKSKQWLETAKQHYLALIRTLCPNYTPARSGEQKIGPKLINAKPTYEQQRQARAQEVAQLRQDSAELQAVMMDIATLTRAAEATNTTKTSPLIDAIKRVQEQSKPLMLLNIQGFQPSSSIAHAKPQTNTTKQPPRPRPKFH